MARYVGLTSLFVLLMSGLAHLATFVPLIRLSVEYVFPLQLAALACFGCFVFATVQIVPRKKSGRFYLSWNEAQQRRKEVWLVMEANTPRWLIIACAWALVYVWLTMVVQVLLLERASPEVIEGKYTLMNHGRLVRKLTKVEYDLAKARELRVVSGAWIVLSLMPTVFFLSTWPRYEEQKRLKTQPPWKS